MIRTRPARATHAPRGQVLVLFILMLVGLLALASLVLDAARAYSLQRFERSVADAAALAGAQDLQQPNTRAITATDQQNARTDALALLARELGASTAPTCSPSADIADCSIPGTSYLVSVKTPSPSAVNVTPDHAVQVTVRQANFSLTIGRVIGLTTWNVGSTSVAGLGYASKYAVVTLQPPQPKPNGTDANLCKDLNVSGNNTVLNVVQGDVGTNTSATTTNAGIIRLASGYLIDHYDDITNASCGLFLNPTWATDASGNPHGKHITALIPDPGYMYASFTGAPSFATQAAGVTACNGSSFPSDWTTLLTGATCYQPGVYTDTHGFKVGTGQTAYLMPGAYSFPYGLSVQGSLTGGLVNNKPGVVIVFPTEIKNGLNPNNAENFVLNMGGETCTADTCRATPAIDFAGNPVQTPQGLAITMEVGRDNNCFSGNTPINDANCNLNAVDSTISIAGNALVQVAGVLYGPSDNMQISGSSTQGGFVGQLISWTVSYSGGSTLTQEYPGGPGNGVLHLDAACSGPGSPCTP